jgi:endonuclease/exonuclease/phosphatase family metal-dependent hydrolase
VIHTSTQPSTAPYFKIFLSLIFFLMVLFSVRNRIDASDFVNYSAPEFLTFEELVQVSQLGQPGGELGEKLKRLWRTPIVSNEAYFRGVRPPKREDVTLGPMLRVATWNIEKSLQVEGAAKILSDRDQFLKRIDLMKVSPNSESYLKVVAQRELIANADVILLQEMDIGVKRSGYLNSPKVLADTLNMNYAYGASYLEVDPAYLGLENITFESGAIDQDAMDFYRVDKNKYKGMFGSAVLSRYPIESVTVFPLKRQGYDWYSGEKEKIGFFEVSRRFGAKSIFLSQMHRELKVGGRNFMRVDLNVPGLPNDTLTIINIHLEIKCLPKARTAQIEEILGYINGIKNPVIMAGDFNSAPGDLSPTSVVRETTRKLKDPSTWLSLGISEFAPQSLLVNTTRSISNITKNFQDPTATHVPVIAPNHVAALFKAIEAYRFDDGYVFDFRGDPERSVNGRAGLLSNANQRDRAGYKTTFELKRTIAQVIGKYRLDWFFVKSFLQDPRDENGPYQFAPHFGATLEEFNTSLKVQISDHHPIIVDLPFLEVDL